MFQAGQNIKAIRELKNFTQDYVASQLNMSISNYSNIETGKTDITITRLQQIAQVLEIDFLQIIFLNRSHILNTGNPSYSSDLPVHQPEIRDALIRQLQIKDDQIQRLLSIVEKCGS
jgi:transcriptional regulator with XRE-family HTH domain